MMFEIDRYLTPYPDTLGYVSVSHVSNGWFHDIMQSVSYAVL